MRKTENDCMGCAAPAYPCMEDCCPYRHRLHLYCDDCKNDVDLLYVVDGAELCEDCLKEHFPTVELED